MKEEHLNLKDRFTIDGKEYILSTVALPINDEITSMLFQIAPFETMLFGIDENGYISHPYRWHPRCHRHSRIGNVVEVVWDMNNRERQKLKYYLYRLKKAYRWFKIEMQVWFKERKQ